MKKNMYGKKLKKITGAVMACAIAISGMPIIDIVNYTNTEMVYADEVSDFSVKVKTDKDDTGYLQEKVGEIIFVETLITGGVGEKQYKYEIKNAETGEIEKSTDYKDCYEEWGMFGVVLTSVGKRELVVYIKDEKGNVTKSAPYIIDAIEGELDAGIFLDEEVTLRSYTVGDTVELSIVAGGGSGNYTYRYEMKNSDTGNVTVLKDFCKENIIQVELPESGDTVSFYGIVKDSAGNESQTNSVAIVVEPGKYSGVFSIEGSSDYLECSVGEVKFSSIFLGDESINYEYKYEIIDAETRKVEKSVDYSSSNAFGIVINTAGTKLVKGYIKDAEGNEFETNIINVYVKATSLSAILSVSHNGNNLSDEYFVGDELLLNAVAMGGSGYYTYKYEILDNATGKKIVLKDYCEESVYTEYLKEEGQKEYVVSVKDSNGDVIETNYVKIDVKGTSERNRVDNNEKISSYIKFWFGNTINTLKFIFECFNNNI